MKTHTQNTTTRQPSSGSHSPVNSADTKRKAALKSSDFAVSNYFHDTMERLDQDGDRLARTMLFRILGAIEWNLDSSISTRSQKLMAANLLGHLKRIIDEEAREHAITGAKL